MKVYVCSFAGNFSYLSTLRNQIQQARTGKDAKGNYTDVD